jgi:A/G-specific adenine glycosylase
MAATERLAGTRRAILSWYRAGGRPFPWRKTRDPYRVLVSEIMLQQTQADRVASLFPIFLSKYPTVDDLCDASRADVVRAWKGLGYNNRAVRLHSAVREIRSSYGGRVPSEIGELDSLPGIGKYTSHAVACFAYGRRTPLVDVNVRRVLSRMFRKMKDPAELLPEAVAWKTAGRILPRDAYTWNQALMELGARICTARAPRCDGCPVRRYCASSACLRKYRTVNRRGKGGGDGPPTARPTRRPPLPEPAHFGVPRRIWRGRIVEHLRGSGKPVSLGALRRAVMPEGRNGSTRWLELVLDTLEKDGIVHIIRSGVVTRVHLAA